MTYLFHVMLKSYPVYCYCEKFWSVRSLDLPAIPTDLVRHFVALTCYLARAHIGEMIAGMSEKKVNKLDIKLQLSKKCPCECMN